MKPNWLHDFVPTKNKQYLSAFLATILIVAGCSTESEKQNFAGVATATGLVVATPLVIPLIPFTTGYNAIEDSKERKNDAILYEKLDPVYQKRIEMINARSPKADAQEAWNEGATAFLPSMPKGSYYLGLEATEYNLKNGEENRQQIATNKFLTYLQTLLSDDPLQQQAQTFDKRYVEFLHVRWDYEKAFNLEIYQKIQNSKPSKTTVVPIVAFTNSP
jgi:hypothetical protein